MSGEPNQQGEKRGKSSSAKAAKKVALPSASDDNKYVLPGATNLIPVVQKEAHVESEEDKFRAAVLNEVLDALHARLEYPTEACAIVRSLLTARGAQDREPHVGAWRTTLVKAADKLAELTRGVGWDDDAVLLTAGLREIAAAEYPLALLGSSSGTPAHIATVVAGNLCNRLEWANDDVVQNTPIGMKLYAPVPLLIAAIDNKGEGT